MIEITIRRNGEKKRRVIKVDSYVLLLATAIGGDKEALIEVLTDLDGDVLCAVMDEAHKLVKESSETKPVPGQIH